MNLPQRFIDVLTAELRTSLPTYTVEAREPAETELAAKQDVKQIFVTTEGFEPGEQVADGGVSTMVILPVFVSCVMQRPGTTELAEKVLRRRQTLIQAVQRAMNTFAQQGEPVFMRWIQEAPSLVEGFYVSIQGVELHFDLNSQEAL